MTKKKRYEYWKESDTAYDTKIRYGQYFRIIDKKDMVNLLNEQDGMIQRLNQEITGCYDTLITIEELCDAVLNYDFKDVYDKADFCHMLNEIDHKDLKFLKECFTAIDTAYSIDELVSLLNEFQKENFQFKQQISEQAIQLDYLKNENQHMKDVLDENKQLKEFINKIADDKGEIVLFNGYGYNIRKVLHNE